MCEAALSAVSKALEASTFSGGEVTAIPWPTQRGQEHLIPDAWQKKADQLAKARWSSTEEFVFEIPEPLQLLLASLGKSSLQSLSLLNILKKLPRPQGTKVLFEDHFVLTNNFTAIGFCGSSPCCPPLTSSPAIDSILGKSDWVRKMGRIVVPQVLGDGSYSKFSLQYEESLVAEVMPSVLVKDTLKLLGAKPTETQLRELAKRCGYLQPDGRVHPQFRDYVLSRAVSKFAPRCPAPTCPGLLLLRKEIEKIFRQSNHLPYTQHRVLAKSSLLALLKGKPLRSDVADAWLFSMQPDSWTTEDVDCLLTGAQPRFHHIILDSELPEYLKGRQRRVFPVFYRQVLAACLFVDRQAKRRFIWSFGVQHHLPAGMRRRLEAIAQEFPLVQRTADVADFGLTFLHSTRQFLTNKSLPLVLNSSNETLPELLPTLLHDLFPQ